MGNRPRDVWGIIIRLDHGFHQWHEMDHRYPVCFCFIASVSSHCHSSGVQPRKSGSGRGIAVFK